MATVAAAGVLAAPLLPSSVRTSSSRAAPAIVLRQTRTFHGLKAHDKVISLGVLEAIDHHFARIVKSCKASSSMSRAKGGAIASTCQVGPDTGVQLYNLVSSIGGLLITTVILAAFLLWVEKSIEEAAR